jgi:hypothetical protein
MQLDNIMTKPNLVFKKQMTNSKKVQLVFPKSKGSDVYLPNDLSKYSGKDFFRLYCADTNEVLGWFDDFTTDSIELWINSIIQTESETKLIIGGSEEAGLRVVLRPKTNNHTDRLNSQFDDKLLSTNGHLMKSDSH